MDNIFPIFIPIVIAIVIGITVISNIIRQRKLATMTVVIQGAEYPNNHHVMGVGYYHAASQKWFPTPWNEYREDRGYYWDGSWHSTPDQRIVLRSVPASSEIDRVNQEWRKADPNLSLQFWNTVEQQGFGTAIRRSEGS
jgi:hypothetical protein